MSNDLINNKIIKNLWAQTKVICGNHSGEINPPEMIIKKTGNVVYYGCSTYSAKSPNTTCRNAVKIGDFEKMLEHLALILTESFDNFEFRNLTNYEWVSKNNKLKFKVLSHTNQELVIMITNIETIQGGKL